MAQVRHESNAEDFESFVAYLTLTYHESRNVRHIIRHLDPEPYEKVMHYLAKDPKKAWMQIQDQRRAACATKDPEKALAIFRDRFGLTLEDLQELYMNENWRHASSWGGHKWIGITRAVEEVYRVFCSGDYESARELLRNIASMHHNTGMVAEKLTRLDSSLARVEKPR